MWSHIFTQNFDSWSDEYFDPQTRKKLLLAWSPDSMKNTTDPDPARCNSRSRAVIPDPGPFQAFDP